MNKRTEKHTKMRIGETRKMHNGMNATIVAYRSSTDIDVQFEDGEIAKNKRYSAFEEGSISDNKRAKRIGETRTMNNGMNATIIAYHDSGDIDVQFEDGTVVKNRTYCCFLKGMIANPAYRIGETKKMKCGMTATIINRHTGQKIDVQFEDGTIIKNKTYTSFAKGVIGNPNLEGTSAYAKEHGAQTRLGEVCTMNNGMNAKIVAYRGANDIDIEFEDGTIVYKREYAAFKRGSVANPSSKKRPEKQ